MSKYIIAISVIVALALIATAVIVGNWQSSENGEVAKLKEQIQKLQSDNTALTDKIGQDPLIEAAKLGLTDRPGWQFRQIIADGGVGSIVFKMTASTVRNSAVLYGDESEFSWRSRSDEAIESARLRREGEVKKK